MEKNRAITIIEDAFDKAFNKESFTLFIKNLLNNIDASENKYREYRGNMIKESFRPHIVQYTRIGEYIDPHELAMDILAIEVTEESKLDQARTSLRNFVIDHLGKFEKDYALAAFYSKTDRGQNWRFSFIKLEHQTTIESGKIKHQKIFTPARRYSFLVGEDEKSHTAKRQLLPLLQNVYNNPLIEDIEKAFSIEVVTNDFFEQYKELFLHISDYFNKDNKQIRDILQLAGTDISRFTKKLLGQIVFLYFLQKKGWLGVFREENWGKGQKNFLQLLFNKAKAEGKNFYKDYLQYLFYEALARQHGDNNYYERFDCCIPFLNGGLFEADYDWKETPIHIPNTLFRNEEKIKKTGDVGTGILDVFDRYNFTIREDEPLEKEVAIDPEMLGKVFENMLEIKERKSKGAFYTPREVVHYMCQESLIYYLNNAINHEDSEIVPKEDIEVFVHNGILFLENDERVVEKGKETDNYNYRLPESIRINANGLDKLLTNIKICDPAIGSGAFPIGLLHELVNLQLILRKHLSSDYLSQKSNIIGLKPEDCHSDKYIYRIKRHSIQESIYGVDIDASAIDIARLRLWLSLVVDEENFDNIEALPNLDYKIVIGDSLISKFGDGIIEVEWDKKTSVGTAKFYVETVQKLLKDISEKQKVFFRTINITEKNYLRKEIRNLKLDILYNQLFFNREAYINKTSIRGGFSLTAKDIHYNSERKLAIEKIDKTLERIEFLKNNPQELFNYFDWKLDFPNVMNPMLVEEDKSGFDIVIGNPPYISYYGNKGQKLTEGEKTSFLFAYEHIKHINDRINSMNLMTEKGIKLLNRNGFLTFITNKTLSVLPSYQSIREYLLKNTEIVYLITNLTPFKAIVDCIVFGICFKNVNLNIKYYSGQLNDFSLVKKTIFQSNPKYELHQSEFGNIINIIEKQTLPLGNLITINRGVNIGGCFDDFFSPIPQNGYYKYLSGTKNIKPFYYEWEESDGYFKFDTRLEQKLKLAGATIALGNPERYVKSRLFIPESGQQIMAAYSTERIYGSYGLLIGSSSNEDSLYYSLLLLNSEIITFYAIQKELLRKGKKATPHIGTKGLKTIPIPILMANNHLIIKWLSRYLYYICKKQNRLLHVNFFKMIANSIVYELYFPEEIHAANKGIIEYLHDLKPISDSMTNEQKLAIINSEFERLYDPYHPVRNNVETIENVEIVRIIKESLKK
ncbi:hypothetical protein EZS27_006284 [termite gut metagenome]|uniref:site-specific DNA-methyltransferase (adenine-specific) n=1 Tax=termite gut metagenome TaxID=433724 RepID=A0A5J4SJ13_9ZZZZ